MGKKDTDSQLEWSGAGPDRAVPPRGWYSKYRRNVDQLTAEPGGARDLIGTNNEQGVGRQGAPVITHRATRGLSPVNEQNEIVAVGSGSAGLVLQT